MLSQATALDVLRCGVNAFLTGEPGSGKTFTTRQYLRWLRERRVPYAVTASTGIAATHLGGLTVHAWCGVGVRRVVDEALLERIREIPPVLRRVTDAKVLVIDEVSMLSAETLDAVDQCCRGLRDDPRPFGGLQVVFVGDFFQLPPVRRDDDDLALPPDAVDDFAFRAAAWREAKPVVCYLGEQHRQEDPRHLAMLDAIRRRAVTDETRAVIAGRCGVDARPGAVRLYSHNADVDRINADALAQLPGETRAFAMSTKGAKGVVQALVRGCTSPESLELKRGAKVVFTRNDPQGRWVNGTLGVVAGYDVETGFPLVRDARGETLLAEPASWSYEEDGKVVAEIQQVPLRLAWALTVHKSQGMSLDAAHIDLSRAFAWGQGYVALSRVRTLEGMTLEGFNARALEVHPGVVAQDARFRDRCAALRDRFGALSREDVTRRQVDFVIASGGTLPRSRKAAPKEAKPAKRERRPPEDRKERRWAQTVAMLREGRTVEEVAAARARTVDTVLGHLEGAAREGQLARGDLAHLRAAHADAVVAVRTCLRVDASMGLKALHERLGARFSHAVLRLARVLAAHTEP